MSEIHERLKEIRESKKMNQTEFSNFVGIGRSTLGMLEVGKREILDRHIKSIATICNINEDWFRTGNGTMENPPNEEAIKRLVQEFGLDEMGERGLKALLQLNDENRKTVVQYIEFVLAEYQNHDHPDDIVEAFKASQSNQNQLGY